MNRVNPTNRLQKLGQSTLVSALALAAPALAQAQTNYTTKTGYESLVNALEAASNRNADYKIIRNANNIFAHGQPNRVGPRVSHRQHSDACLLYANNAVTEFLGYSRSEEDSHLNYTLIDICPSAQYYASGTYDVGYKYSPEHIMGLINDRSASLPAGKWDTSYYCRAVPTTNGTFDGNQRDCRFGGSSPDYGQCQTTSNARWDGFDAMFHDDGATDADESAFGALEYLIQNNTAADNEFIGCTDYRFERFKSTDTDTVRRHRILAYRTAIKAFIDQNIPLSVWLDTNGTTGEGGNHNEVIIGYGALDQDNLPRTVIVLSVNDMSNNVPIYRVFTDMEQSANWSYYSKGGAPAGTPARDYAIFGIRPWNQNLNAGCKNGGWAKNLDSQLTALGVTSYFTALCDNSADACNRPYYGTNLECWRSGSLLRSYNIPAIPNNVTAAKLESPTTVIGENVTCDELRITDDDGQSTKSVSSFTAARYGRNATTQAWSLLSSYNRSATNVTNAKNGTNSTGRTGTFSSTTLADWQDNYYLVGHDLTGTVDMVGTSLTVNYTDGTSRTMLIAPPDVYTVALRCYSGTTWSEFKAEANQNVSDVYYTTGGVRDWEERQFLYSNANKACDRVDLTFSVAKSLKSGGATIMRQWYDVSRGEWRDMSIWTPDKTSTSAATWFGTTYTLSWDAVWPESYYLVGHDAGGTTDSDRKTKITLDFTDDTTRSIEITPAKE